MTNKAKTIWGFLFIIMMLTVCVFGCGDDDDDDSSGSGGTDDDDVADDDDNDSTDDDVTDDDDDATGDDDDDDNDDNDDDSQVVFVQVTDIHQSRGSGSGKGAYSNWFKSLEYLYDVVQPDFVVATGDLTDGEAKGQSQLDWDDYRNAILDAGFTSENYHDLPGNHDGHSDSTFNYYLNNGISGAIMHSWNMTRGMDEYAFMTVQTAYYNSMEGQFSQEAYNWTLAELLLVDDATHIFTFTHHNSVIVPDAGLLGPSGLLATYDVTAFVAGHRHFDQESTFEGTRFIKTANHYKGMTFSDDGWMRIFVLSGQTWSCSPMYVVDRGPQVIITSPQDKRLAVNRSPDAHQVTGQTTITAMIFGEGMQELEIMVDDSTLEPMTSIDSRVFTFDFDFNTLAVGDHTIRVEDPNRTANVNGVDSITVESY